MGDIITFGFSAEYRIQPHLQILVETIYRTDGCIAYGVAKALFDPGPIPFQDCGPITEA